MSCKGRPLRYWALLIQVIRLHYTAQKIRFRLLLCYPWAPFYITSPVVQPLTRHGEYVQHSSANRRTDGLRRVYRLGGGSLTCRCSACPSTSPPRPSARVVSFFQITRQRWYRYVMFSRVRVRVDERTLLALLNVRSFPSLGTPIPIPIPIPIYSTYIHQRNYRGYKGRSNVHPRTLKKARRLGFKMLDASRGFRAAVVVQVRTFVYDTAAPGGAPAWWVYVSVCRTRQEGQVPRRQVFARPSTRGMAWHGSDYDTPCPMHPHAVAFTLFVHRMLFFMLNR